MATERIRLKMESLPEGMPGPDTLAESYTAAAARHAPLNGFLHKLDAGPVQDLAGLGDALCAILEHLRGHSEAGLAAEQLGQITAAEWRPPILSFTVEPGASTVQLQCGRVPSHEVNVASWSITVRPSFGQTLLAQRRAASNMSHPEPHPGAPRAQTEPPPDAEAP
jgi:hypothetical protein